MVVENTWQIIAEEGRRVLKVALNIVRENGDGEIRIYEVDEEAFKNALKELSPSAEEEWRNLAEWVEENGKLCYKVSPDYSITVEG
jgi:hypothetical protein